MNKKAEKKKWVNAIKSTKEKIQALRGDADWLLWRAFYADLTRLCAFCNSYHCRNVEDNLRICRCPLERRKYITSGTRLGCNTLPGMKQLQKMERNRVRHKTPPDRKKIIIALDQMDKVLDDLSFEEWYPRYKKLMR